MIKVWTDAQESGYLDRLGQRGSTFAYAPNSIPERAVSVSMPVRVQSWDTTASLAPIFEMNLPEGALRERLRLSFAKATGRFDDFDLLAVIGRSQLGRLRYTGKDDRLNEEVPFQSVDEILTRQRGGDLFRYLLETFSPVSGVSGVQPKVLVRDAEAFARDPAGPAKMRLSESYRGATHIVKLWDANEHPQLAANEYFCLRAAERCGLEAPPFRLAEDGMALVLDRFDLRSDGTYRGFEDFCVLNGRGTDEKYRGSYETAILRRFEQFANSPKVYLDLEQLFTLIALNCALRNGDAHLKNFGILYDDVTGHAQLAPVYDLVTTSVYLKNDRLALTLNGSTEWPGAKELERFGEVRINATPSQLRRIFERICDALSETAVELRAYAKDHTEFAAIGERMVAEWETGAAVFRR